MRKSITPDAIVSIYELIDPVSRKLRYIGVTTDLRRRQREHAKLPQDFDTSPRAMWMRRLIRRGNLPIFVVLGETTADIAEDIETSLINELIKSGERLFNVSQVDRSLLPE